MNTLKLTIISNNLSVNVKLIYANTNEHSCPNQTRPHWESRRRQAF